MEVSRNGVISFGMMYIPVGLSSSFVGGEVGEVKLKSKMEGLKKNLHAV